MKKFLCTIPLQTGGRGLEKAIYIAADNEKLNYEEAISFPIISVINGYVQRGESIELLVMKQDGEGTDRNYEEFISQIDNLCSKKEITYSIQLIHIVFEETAETHLRTFVSLISHVREKDILYACMTYGTKPIPIVEMMALNYAYRAVRHVQIGCIVYGQKRWEEKIHTIYDITSLFSMDEIVHEISTKDVKDPLRYINDILDFA